MKCPTNLRWSVLHKIIMIMEVSNLLLCARGTYSVKKILNRFFWSVFSRNWTEYDKSPYSVQISEKDSGKSEIRKFFSELQDHHFI